MVKPEPSLCWRDDRDSIPTQEYQAEFSGYFPINPLFCVFQHNINVDIESAEIAKNLLAVLQFNNNALAACLIQCVEWS